MNWRRGLFRTWILVSIIWVVGWAITTLPAAKSKIEMAPASDVEIMLPDVGTPPKHFYLNNVLAQLGREGRMVIRAANLLLPELTILIAAPVSLLLFGVLVGWVLNGFKKNQHL